MRRTGLLALFVALSGAVACGVAPAARAAHDTSAAEPAPAVPTASAADDERGPLLWRVSAGAGASLYLFGTVHTGGRAMVPEAVWPVFEASAGFVMEIDPATISEQLIKERAPLPEGQSLRAMVGEESFAVIVAKLGAAIPEAALDRLQPWFITMLLMQQVLPGGEAMDAVLHAEAADDGKRLAYLETAAEQFDAIAMSVDGKGLAQITGDLEAVKTALDRLVAAYQDGDVQELLALTKDSKSVTPLQYEVMFLARNRRWLPKLEDFLEAGGGQFVAVGAGHLPGPGGVLELLEQRGFTVERVRE